MKIKQLLCCTLSILTILCLCSCRDGEMQKTDEIPETLLLRVELPQDYPETATTYAAEFFVVDEEKAASVFGSGEAFTRTEYPRGPHYRYETAPGFTKYISIKNGSEQHGTTAMGGLSYVVSSDKEDGLENSGYRNWWNNSLRKKHAWEYGAGDLVNVNEELNECPQGNLSFGALSEVLKEVEEKMTLCGFPEVQLYAADACSAEILNQNRIIYNASLQGKFKMGSIQTEFSTDDEYYYVTYRQMVDKIPLSAIYWFVNTDIDTDTAAFTEISLFYGKSGLLELNAEGLYSVGDPISTAPVISPEDALDVFLQQYNQSTHVETSEIINFELNYFKIVGQDGMRLRPAWIITTKTFQSESEMIKIYVVSADSGVLLETDADTR